jgi:hypothetical protein
MAYNETALYCDSVAYTAVAQWAATHAYTVGNIVRQLVAPSLNNERTFICIVAGTSQGSEPTWVLTRGAATNETTVHWMECSGLPALNGDKTNTNKWAANAGNIALGAVIQNVAGTIVLICTTAGTGGTGAEPSWNTTAGATTADGSVTWTCIGTSFANWASPAMRLTFLLNSNTTWLLNAGMTIYVGDDHNESTTNGAFGSGFSNSIVCIDHTVSLPAGSGNLKITAAVTATSGSISFHNAGDTSNYVYGVQFVNSATNNNITIGNASGQRMRFEHCVFSLTGSGSGFIIPGNNVSAIVEFKDCTFSISLVGKTIALEGAVAKLENCTFTAPTITSGNQLITMTGVPQIGNTIFEGCDFSGITFNSGSGLVGGSVPYGYTLFKDCLFPSSLPAIYRGGDAAINYPAATIDINRCDIGGTAIRNERHTPVGTEVTSTGVVRTGGASDGATPISHQLTTFVNTGNSAYSIDNRVNIFNAMPLTIWNSVTGSNRNIILRGIANDSRVPNNDEVWFDVEYLGSSSSPKGSYARGSKANVLAAGSALTVDTSAWDSAATARANTTAYTVGQVIKTASNAGRVFFCTTAGTSAGSEPGGYASAVDGGSVTDGTATFRAGCRFSQTLTLSAPQPQQAGYLYAYPKIGRPSMTYYLDPMPVLS